MQGITIDFSHTKIYHVFVTLISHMILRSFKHPEFLDKEMYKKIEELNISFSEAIRAAEIEWLNKPTTKNKVLDTNRSLKTR